MEHSYYSRSLKSKKTTWDCLGPDLTELILSYLPIPSIIRASSVCKLWNSIIRSHSFKTQVSNHSKRLPCLFIFGPNKNFIANNNDSHVFAFDPDYDSWIKLSKIILLTNNFFAASNGLFFFTTSSGKFSFQGVVNRQTMPLGFFRYCNPLIGVYNEPPDCSKPARFIAVGGIGPADGRLAFDIYNPHHDSWELISPHVPGTFKRSDILLSSALFKGKFYIRGIYSGFISSFDMEKHLWTDIQTLRPPGTLFSYLISCQGQLVLAGLCSVNCNLEFKLWKIDEKTLDFSEIGVMPGDMLSSFIGKKGIKEKLACLKCIGLGDIVYVFNEESRWSKGVCVCEIYDSGKYRWTRIPDLPQPVKNVQMVVSFSSSVSVLDILLKGKED
ncbi:hypothetical protein CDL12_01616 [Handroanthus impetiginosus]|uniref:F-box domain-containing protein n=1 Tax=Handroanthus impetiginosus TaxID=429701 RepID=A0A2G9I799_9LAMI|nr:hypothetical protein CDL12_01616 [Handroanthus impetiginosus]